MKVVGKRIGEFTDRNTGKVINFGQLHVTYEDKDVDGTAVDLIKMPADLLGKLSSIKVGDAINILYNKYGKVADISVL